LSRLNLNLYFLKIRIFFLHTFEHYANYGVNIVNIVTFGKWRQNAITMLVSNSSFSVDNFFLLSGLLASYTFMKQTKTGGAKISFFYILRYYLRRIWRIAPTYWLILILCVGLTRYFVHGPFIGFLSDPRFCAKDYYLNLLFIINFDSSLSVFFNLNLFTVVSPSCVPLRDQFFSSASTW
jgi:peptidoglycan/LPS O-acetylase OafA/YrhL